jgi:hypothetical protein
VFIEVKDFRGHRIQNKLRIENGEDAIEVEVAQKFRDTLAGIVGGVRNSTHHAYRWKEYLNLLINKGREVHTILWLEEDRPILPPSVVSKRNKAKGGTYTDKLKVKMKWLNCRVLVVNSSSNPYSDFLNTQYLPA